MLAIFTGLLGTLIGLFFGNRLALGREKRKEFNEIALPIFEVLEKQRISAKSGSFPNSANSFGENSLIGLKQHISSSKYKRLDISLANYVQAKKSCGTFNSVGDYDFNKPDVLISAIEDLQKYVRRK
ncbi:hypothetical protein PVT67_17850 [Gallaecimonas kandeliae]|uniref:hypothetical protein n=1 Tax=Gallaecimonas kandeliae TaxID=3029055 RepID=UPI0026493B28|nr:hypothetical protein [Gallaecimonas kandeliae]WKE65507.1 hypothetical protein PVT67_17850 [Gallaecimonas kandeliae]